MLIDTHTHIYDEAFDADRAEVMARAQEVGVGKLLLPAIDSGSHERLFGLCSGYPDLCLPMMGLHPTSVNDNPRYREELQLVEEYLRRLPVRRFYAIGEIGLDLYWSRDYRAQQEEVFIRQVDLSLEHGLPVVVHTRDAWEPMCDILSDYRGRGLRGVMHSFSGTAQDYEFINGCGDFMFGIGGVATYKKSALPEIIVRIPLNQIVLETDSPYLPPVPYRGKRNESAYLTYICTRVAEIKGVAYGEVERQTTENARRMFGI